MLSLKSAKEVTWVLLHCHHVKAPDSHEKDRLQEWNGILIVR